MDTGDDMREQMRESNITSCVKLDYLQMILCVSFYSGRGKEIITGCNDK